jgi:hypothetical protein
MLPESISAFLRGLRWQDGADVVLLTVAISWAYTWMRRTLAVQMTFGMITLVAASTRFEFKPVRPQESRSSASPRAPSRCNCANERWRRRRRLDDDPGRGTS